MPAPAWLAAPTGLARVLAPLPGSPVFFERNRAEKDGASGQSSLLPRRMLQVAGRRDRAEDCRLGAFRGPAGMAAVSLSTSSTASPSPGARLSFRGRLHARRRAPGLSRLAS